MRLAALPAGYNQGMYRNLIDGLWFGLSMLGGAYLGWAVVPTLIEFTQENRPEGTAACAVIGAVVGGVVWKARQKASPLP